MPSALIPPVGRKPAVPLAGQLAHESYVRPGPLVLGTAFLRSPTAASDRDRHSCCRWHEVPGARAFLPGSACRHADRTISSRRAFRRTVLGVWSLRILDGELSMNAAISPASVHRQGLFGKPIKALRSEVCATLHRPNDPGERDNFILLAAHKRVALEEGDHSLEEILPTPHDQHVRVIVRPPVVLP